MMPLRRASTTVIQFVGNVLKGWFLVEFLLRPQRRYRIPAVAGPFIRSTRSRMIPRIVWQTNYTREVTAAVYVNYLFNRLMAPTHEFRFLVDDDCEAFIASCCPQALEGYKSLQIGAARADLWRAVVLLKRGGIYIDADAAFSWPPELVLRAEQMELFARNPDGTLTNYFFAAAPENSFFAKIVEQITANILADELTSVYHMTGPTVVHDIVHGSDAVVESSKVICRQGQFTAKRFQYPDRLRGYWALEETRSAIVGTKT